MKQIKAVLFDCDGTLLDTEEISSAAVHAVFTDYGLSYTPEELNAEFIGVHLSDILNTINQRHGLDIRMDAFLDIYTPYMLKFIPLHMRILDDTLGYIQSLRDRGLKLTVGSNGVREVVVAELEAGGLLPFFDIILTADDVPNPKPAPDMYLNGMRAVGIDDPESCLVIEDSVTGIRAAVAAGMVPIGYTGLNPDPAGLAVKLKEAGAFQVVSRLKDLDLLIK